MQPMFGKSEQIAAQCEVCPAFCSKSMSAVLLQSSAVGQGEEREAIRLGDYLRPRLCHKRLHRGTARRTGYKIGRIIKKLAEQVPEFRLRDIRFRIGEIA